jgi:hypothetical protein
MNSGGVCLHGRIKQVGSLSSDVGVLGCRRVGVARLRSELRRGKRGTPGPPEAEGGTPNPILIATCWWIAIYDFAHNLKKELGRLGGRGRLANPR